jgi:triosephosphate isomerase
MKKQRIILANWKMNGHLAFINDMTASLNKLELTENVTVILCPSSPYLFATANEIKNKQIQLGAQNVSEHAKGAHTGEVSANMLKECHVKYVLTGHSERRRLYNETSIQVANKVELALEAGLTPVLCIGESDSERSANQTETKLTSQLQPVIDKIGIEKFNNIIVAYEPIWAIGTGKSASPEVAQEIHAFIRQFLATYNADIAAKIPLLYGGSVNATNSEELFSQPDIDGGLIGGASLIIDEFTKICSISKGL